MSANYTDFENDARRSLPKRGIDEECTASPSSAEKRQRTSDDETESDQFTSILLGVGCDLSTCAQGTYVVEDPRRMCRALEQKLTLNEPLRRTFLDGLREHLEPMEVLHAALKPMEVLDQDAPITGDSFIHALLSVSAVQRELSEILLHRLCDFVAEEEAPEGEASIPQLILGQFRWLHAPLDGRYLTSKLLEVLPAMPAAAQHDALGLLEEVADDDDYENVVEAVSGLVEDDPCFLVPAFKALSNMAQGDEHRNIVVDLVMSRFQAAAVEDLPEVVAFLLHAVPSPQVGPKVMTLLREGLHFATPSDPRLAGPDRKGKGRVGGLDQPEPLIIESMRQALQVNFKAADASLKAVENLTSPSQHRTFDLWLLLVLAASSPDRARAVEMAVVKKMREGHADHTWIEIGMKGHQSALKSLFQCLLSLAQRLVRAPQHPVSTGGIALYRSLFLEFKDAYSRQEILRTLHSHLGSHVVLEISSALGVLRDLAAAHPDDLMQHASFVAAVLDYVDKYAAPQAAAAFEAFAELVAGSCERRDAMGEGSEAGSTRSRFEDELFVFLQKQLSGSDPVHRHIGVVGTVALVKRLAGNRGASPSGECNAHDGDRGAAPRTAVGEKYKEATALLHSALDGHFRSPDTFAMLCDEMARVIHSSSLPRRLMMDLSTKLKEILEEKFLDDPSQGDGRAVAMAQWWDLNEGQSNDVAVRLVPYCSTMNTGGEAGGKKTGSGGIWAAQSESIPAVFALLRLVCGLEMKTCGNLQTVDALLGCPFFLFDQELLKPDNFAHLSADGKRTVLLGTFYAINWCRELANSYGPLLLPSSTSSDEDGPGAGVNGCDDMELKIMGRIRGACQLEAALRVLLADAPASFTLPALNGAAAAPKPLRPTKPGSKGGKKGAAASKAKHDAAALAAGEDDGAEPEATKTVTSGGSTKAAGTALVGIGAGGSGAVAPGGEVTVARSMFRPLMPSAFPCLVVGTSGDEACYSSLAGAGYVLEDVCTQLNAALAPKKALFGNLIAKQPNTPQPVASPSEILTTLLPLLPALRKHLDVAFQVLSTSETDDQLMKKEHRTLWAVAFATTQHPLVAMNGSGPKDRSSAYLAVLEGNKAAKEAVALRAAAGKVVLLGLDTIKCLLSYPELTTGSNQKVLQALLTAFAMDTGVQQQLAFIDQDWSDKEIGAGIREVYKYLKQLMPELQDKTPDSSQPIASDDEDDEHPPGSMERWMAVIKTQDALLSLDQRLQGGLTAGSNTAAKRFKRLGIMRQEVSKAALNLLQRRWDDPVSSSSAGGRIKVGTGAWKAAQVAEALRLHLDHAPDAQNAVENIIKDIIDVVPLTRPAPRSDDEGTTYPSYTSTTLATWYDCTWKKVQKQWKKVVESAESAGKMADPDGDMVDQIMTGLVNWSKMFYALAKLVRTHDVQRVHVVALNSSLPVVESFKKVEKFLAKFLIDYSTQFFELAKALQRAINYLQTVCSESKARSDEKLTAIVPKAKKAYERFICSVAGVLEGLNLGSAVSLGERQHRDLMGRLLPSQLHPDVEEEEEEDEEDEQEDEEEEEVEEEEEA